MMAGLDLGTASRFLPNFQLQRSRDSGDDGNNPNHNQYSGDHHDDGSHHHGVDLGGAGNPGPGDIVARRPRGRPPGSKNKPKPPVIITRESANTLRAHILEVGSGCDVFECVAMYAGGGSGGSASSAGAGPSSRRRRPPGATSLTVFLAGGQGQVVGGSVVGELTAAGPVIVIAASFTNVAYERLPLDEEEQQLHMQPPASQPQSVGGAAAGNSYPDPSSGLPFFNLPLNNMGSVQLPVENWPGNNSAPRPPF
ncbi:hypothetical protein NL676_010474 [Syzygium grande]|nr:hypothetical protein NL676_010474 [Syzygium grande]